MNDQDNLTPAMRQYVEVKQKYPDCIILFRMGDFYETFYEDAKVAAKELEITLTSRGKGEKKAPLAGIPYHALESYLARLVKKGYKVAICEQIEDPRFAKGLVKRDVVRIVTQGTLIENSMLDATTNNYIMVLNVFDDDYAAAFCDISTGELLFSKQKIQNLENDLIKYVPSECILPVSLGVNKELLQIIQQKTHTEMYDDHNFRYDNAYEKCKRQFNVLNMEGFGIQEDKLVITVIGALIAYIEATQFKELTHIKNIRRHQNNQTMILDQATMRNLELIHSQDECTKHGSLLFVLDKTKTAMGARMLKQWVKEPLLNREKIQERLDATEMLKENTFLREELLNALKNMQDLERLISRINYGNATPKDLSALKGSLQQLPLLHVQKNVVEKNTLLKKLVDVPLQEQLITLLENALVDDPPLTTREGGMIRPSFNPELTKLYDIQTKGKEILLEIEQQERQKTNIKTLKISFNRVFGYYIEITKANLHLVPNTYIRKQTTVNSERYITPQLKEYEEQVLTAQEKIKEIEYEIFQSLIQQIAKETTAIQKIAKMVATIDVLCSFAQIALQNNYKKPVITDKNILILKKSRHPVLETVEREFIPNDIELSAGEMMILTGPNMSGKSTLMRQIALNILLAQIGSFVAAETAEMGITDRIFTRVGAHDELVKGQSTFMVEMNETANILNNATSKSFIILDEIGRGTSTFDGIAIAWSVAEHIYNKIKAKTLFATHYHALNKLETEFELVKNYNIAIKETKDDFIFLRRLTKGGTDKSYGIHVARLAGLPAEVIQRAEEIQEKLNEEDKIKSKLHAEKHIQQQTLFGSEQEENHDQNP